MYAESTWYSRYVGDYPTDTDDAVNAPALPLNTSSVSRRPARTLGIGTVALLPLLLLIPLVLERMIIDGENLLGIDIPSTTSSVLSLLLPICAIFIGRRYPQHFGARLAYNLGRAILVFYLLFLIFTVIIAVVLGWPS